jgi:hypothetical protein
MEERPHKLNMRNQLSGNFDFYLLLSHHLCNAVEHVQLMVEIIEELNDEQRL